MISNIQTEKKENAPVSNVSIIIIAKNEGDAIEQCLKSMFNQSVLPQEVIVVDGHSTDNTLEIVRKYPARIIEETGHPSPSNARNLGVQNAKGEIVLVIGADAELDRDCIKNMLPYFDDPKVIVVVPKLEIRLHTRVEKIQKLWFYGTRSRFRTPHGTGSSIQFIRKAIYDEVKFDSSIGFGDDSDFRRRMLKQYGQTHKIIRSEDSKVLVDLPHTLGEIKTQYIWYGRSSRKYYSRYHAPDTLLRLGSLLMPFILLILAAINIFYWNAIYLTIPVFILFVARNLIICIRSKSIYFFDFAFFDIARSILFVYGFIQGFFKKKVGR